MKSQRLIIPYSFFICLLLMVSGIFSAKTSSQLLNSFIYLPLIFYFGLRLLRSTPTRKASRPSEKTTVDSAQALVRAKSIAAIDPEPVAGVPDNNKRIFLKLMGSAGISLVLMALFTKKAQASFFGSSPVGPGVVGVKDIAGVRIDPAEKKPTDGYAITDIDDAGTPAYYGFVKKTGAWYILKNTSGAFLYAKGASGYSANWTGRAALTYDYFNTVFS